MINFFRKIRKQFANENKPFKYMRYAIGEIVLVVIGILIAVQINSVYKKNSQFDISEKLLKRMIVELNINNQRLAFLDDNRDSDSFNILPFSKNEKDLSNCLSILKEAITLNNLEFIVDSSKVSRSNYNLEISVYEEMINTGNLYQIGSNPLINKINAYYRLINKEDNYHIELINRTTALQDDCQNWNYFLIKYESNKEQAISNNSWLFDIQSEDYIKLTNYIKFSHYSIKRNRRRISGIMEASNELINSIEKYISK